MLLFLPRRLLKLLSVAVLVLVFSEPSCAGEPDLDLQSAYKEALANGQYAEAELVAKRRLLQAIRDGQREQLSTAELFNDLAFAQLHNADYDAALQNYELSISIVESNTDMLDIGLVKPLLGIGTAHVRSGRPDFAMPPIERALHVYAVNEGPHNLAQSAGLELLADAYLAMSDYSAAADVADRLVILHDRNFAADSTKVVPALMRKGHILREALEWRAEREAYSDAITILRKHGATSSPVFARPLIGLGGSHQAEYFHEYLRADSAEDLPDEKLLERAEEYFSEALEHALSIERPDWRITAEAQLSLADFFILTEQPLRARRHYRDAWRLLSESPERVAKRREQMEKVTPLLQPTPDLSVALPPEDSAGETRDYDSGYIVAQFTVNSRGRLSDIGLREIEPEGNDAVEIEVKRTLTQSVYRPRFVNGRAVATPEQRRRYQFPVLRPTPGS